MEQFLTLSLINDIGEFGSPDELHRRKPAPSQHFFYAFYRVSMVCNVLTHLQGIDRMLIGHAKKESSTWCQDPMGIPEQAWQVMDIFQHPYRIDVIERLVRERQPFANVVMYQDMTWPYAALAGLHHCANRSTPVKQTFFFTTSAAIRPGRVPISARSACLMIRADRIAPGHFLYEAPSPCSRSRRSPDNLPQVVWLELFRCRIQLPHHVIDAIDESDLRPVHQIIHNLQSSVFSISEIDVIVRDRRLLPARPHRKALDWRRSSSWEIDRARTVVPFFLPGS